MIVTFTVWLSSFFVDYLFTLDTKAKTLSLSLLSNVDMKFIVSHLVNGNSYTHTTLENSKF